MDFNNLSFSSYLGLGYRQVFSLLSSFSIALALAGCNSVTTDQYEATAKTTLTWRVKYSINLANDKDPRFEEFSSASLINRNGEKPEAAVNEDEKGLWWPLPPPRPNINEIEQRKKLQEKHSKPELLRTVKYHLTYKEGEQTFTLPTNHQVYRQVARSYPYGKSLELTLGVNDGSVEKAQPLR